MHRSPSGIEKLYKIMQIVVPAAGRGQRFLEAGYSAPKPLIKVLGKPIIKWSTDGLRGVIDPRFIFLVLKEQIENNKLDEQLKDLYKSCEVVSVDKLTEGAACTVLLAKDKLDPEKELMIVNCDNMFYVDMDRVKQKLEGGDKGVIFYFASNSSALSYVEADGNGYAKRIAEKEVISDKATVGCYYFSKAKYFIESAEYMIKNNLRVKGEFYVAPTFNILIEQGAAIRVFPVEFHFNLGTPEWIDKFKSLFGKH